MTSYRIDLLQNGTKVAEIGDMTHLAYTKKVNAPGLLEFGLPANSPAAGLIADRVEARIWRRNDAMGLPWTRDFVGLIRQQTWTYDDHEELTVRAPGILSMLGWRIVAWYAGTANRSDYQSKPLETILKNLVLYNCGTQATAANGRLRDGSISGLTVESDQGRGPNISLGCAWQNVLDACQKAVGGGGGDFDLVPVSGGYQFRFYPGQLGQDRRSTLLFSLSRANMTNADYVDDATGWATVAISAGEGQQDARTTAIVTGNGYTTTDDYEIFADARSQASPEAEAAAALAKSQRTISLGFDVVQLPASYYGVHYGLGDLVRALYHGVEFDAQISSASIEFKAGAEKIGIKVASWPIQS